MAQVEVVLTAEIHLTIDLPDSKLKSLVVDGEIDFHNYLDIKVQDSFTTDFPKCKISDSTIHVDEPDISNWDSIHKRDLSEWVFDGYKLSRV